MNIRKLAAFALGPLATAALGLATLPITAHYFSPQDIGRLNVLNTLVSFSILFVILGLDQAYIREYHESSRRGRLLRNCFIPGLGILGILTLATIPLASRISYWLYDDSNYVLYLASLLLVFFSYCSRFLSILVRMEERGLAYSASQIAPKLIFFLTVILVAAAGHRNFHELLGGMLFSVLATFLVYLWNTRRTWGEAKKETIHTGELKTLLKFGLPLVPAGLAYWGLIATSTVTLRALSTLTELGIYSVSMSFASIGLVFQSIFSTVWMPTVYRWVSENRDLEKIDLVSRQTLAAVCIIFCVMGCFSWIIDWFLPPTYSGVKFIVLCAMAQPLLYTLSETTVIGINIARKTGYSSLISLSALTVNILLSYYLIPKFGANGAAAANAISFFSFFVLRTEISARCWRPISRRLHYVCLTVVLVVACSTTLLGPALPFPPALAWLIMLAFFLFLFRMNVKQLAALVNFKRITRKLG